MRRGREGPRPAEIRGFAALFLLQAALSFWHQIGNLARTQAQLAATFPQLLVDRDVAIVATSARLTIALIPVALVWFRGSRVARIFVLFFVAVRLLSISESPAVAEVTSLLLATVAAAVLFLPGAARWFRPPANRPQG